MNMFKRIVEIKKNPNRVIATIRRWKDKIKILILSNMVLAVAFLKNIVAADEKNIEYISCPQSKSASRITVNCMGYVEEVCDYSEYQTCLNSISGLLKKADLSLISMQYTDKESSEDTKGFFEKYGIYSTALRGEYLNAKIFEYSQGKIATIYYDRTKAEAKKTRIRIELARYILSLRKKGVDYIILYVQNRSKGQMYEREMNLYRFLSRIGIDYIVGVTPNLRNSGTTYYANRRISKAIYSIGTFLSSNRKYSNKRIVIRLKFKQVNGKLVMYEETYFPYYRHRNKGFISLLMNNPQIISEEKRKNLLSEVEQEMHRIRPANRVLTVEKMMHLMGERMPEKYKYLSDFSIGKVCARSFEVAAGDVFFYRQPFNDVNDIDPVDPKRRLRLAKLCDKKGALLIISFQDNLPVKCPYIVTENPMEGHIDVCSYLKKQFDVKTIGITGSVGKTSTKDMLNEVIKMKYRTLKSERNNNVQVKIGLSIQKLTSSCEVYIQEIGGGRPGGASRHSRMINPHATVITNIGDAHIGNYGSKEKLMEGKLGITEGMTSDGVLYLNGDDELLVKAKPDCKTVYYAVHNKKADYYVENIREGLQCTTFYIVHNGQRTKVKLNVLGEHNVLNAVCCFAMGKQFDILEKDIVEGLSHFKPTGIRQNIVQTCGRKLLLDCYNASSASMKSSLDILSKIKIEKGKKRIAVIGDVTGMGELSEDIHKEMAEILLQNPPDRFIFYGDKVKHTYDIVSNAGIASKFIPLNDRTSLNNLMEHWIEEGDAAAFKGSSRVLLEYSVDMVYGTRCTDQRFLDENEYKRIKKNDLSYNLFKDYGTLVKGPKNYREVVINSKIGKIPIVNIGHAFQYSQVKSVVIPDTVRHIGSKAFLECKKLDEIKMSRNVKFIGSAAFKNCNLLKSIELPEGVLQIGNEAFCGCKNLHEIIIPSTVAQIGKNAFDDCDGIKILCKEGSLAEKSLKKAKISYNVFS